jgi:hypothetical protein
MNGPLAGCVQCWTLAVSIITDQPRSPIAMEDELTTLNRAYISILPRQPYYDWANAVFPEATPMEPEHREATAYAISDDFAVRDLADVVKPHYALIFEMELFGVCTDPEKWPPKRTWKLFTEWFSFHVGSMVWDLAPEIPLLHDPD